MPTSTEQNRIARLARATQYTNIEVHTFYIEGIKPLLMHSCAGMIEKALNTGGPALSKPGKKSSVVQATAQEADAFAYFDEDHNLQFPAGSIKSALLYAGKGRKDKKQAINGLIKPGVNPRDDYFPILHPDTGKQLVNYDNVLVVTAVNQNNNARIVSTRPRILEWAAEVTLELDMEYVSVPLIAELLHRAGRSAGIGSWRPENNGKYGRFILTKVDGADWKPGK